MVKLLLAGSAYRSTLLGFEDKEAEDEFQVQTAAAAWLGDTITDVVFAILVTLIAWQLWAGFAATGKAGHLFIVSNSIFLCRRLMVFWPNSPRKARFRTGLMVALRIQVMLVAYRIDAVLEGPNMAVPASSAAAVVRNVVYLSRVPPLVTMSLGQRIPFRFHLPMQLAAAVWWPWLNAELCRSCSPTMHEAFAGIAQSLTRIVTASMLLNPSARPPVLPQGQACSAVSGLLFLVLTSLLPTAVLFYSETKCRLEFLHERERQRRRPTGKASAAAVRVWIERDASLAVFPLACVLLLPLTGLLWNLLIHVHQMVS